MASRRSRIKGIANIPQRRKTDIKSIEESLPNEVPDGPPVQNDKVNVIENSDEPKNNNNCNDISKEIATHNRHIETVESVSTSIVSPVIKDTPSIDQSIKQAPQRRTFIKPLVNLKSVVNKSKKVEEAQASKPIVNPTPLNSVQSTSKEVEILASAQVAINSDSESVPEPPSPTKLINRSRIKAVPRLTQRRISSTVHGSASESEDDTNKKSYKRIRTESACSTISSCNESAVRVESEVPQKTRDFNTVIQRKCRRTEQSNKMAEARRNFINKYRNKEPDKHKLTMLDLIFYNPATKPMSVKPERTDIRKSVEEETTNVECEEDNIESDEENHIPAPQIKIGANGEIVVDEQSLVIENKQTKKDRANLQNSEVVDGDFDTGYGIYKRAKRSKDWSKDDTLFFYKALNTIGTDFSLMVQLFPGRSRRELKMKFKKEEKINHVLVDKALTRPLQFNIKELKEEVVMRQKMKELEKTQKEEKTKQLETQKKKNTTLSYMRKGSRKDRKTRRKKPKTPAKDLYSQLEKGIASVWNSDDSDDEQNEGDNEDDVDDFTKPTTDISNILKPTRYGRIPKPKTTFTLEDPKVVKIREEHLAEEHHLEPGSLMIVCSQTPTGMPAFKVFMVTESQNKVPVVIPSNVLSNLTKPNPNADEVIPENNYTICHDDSNMKKIEVEIQDSPENNDTVTTAS